MSSKLNQTNVNEATLKLYECRKKYRNINRLMKGVPIRAFKNETMNMLVQHILCTTFKTNLEVVCLCIVYKLFLTELV